MVKKGETLVVFEKLRKKRSGKRGISPVISTVIMTGAIIAILSVTLVFANDMLWSRVAEGEFNASTQLLQTVGLQIDDVAWTTGRTETIRYANKYGAVVFTPSVLTYTVTVNGVPTVYETGIIMFNMPTSSYSLNNGYRETIYPTSDESLVLTGTSAPVARIFAIERTPMRGNYLRVVTAPSPRVMFSSINSTSAKTYYVRMYLPVLTAGESPRLSESLTLTGESLDAYPTSGVTSVNVSVAFPESASGFDSAFFDFPQTSQDITIPSGYDNVVFELYLSEVSVGFGVN